MLGGNRAQRIAEEIKRELSSLILQKLKDPRIGFLTITRVEVSKDLKRALVGYSVMGDEKSKKATGAALEHAHGFLQREIANLLKLRYTPILKFKLDHSIDHSLHMEEIFKKLEEERKGNQ